MADFQQDIEKQNTPLTAISVETVSPRFPATERGFLLPTLFTTDLSLTGRWDYLTDSWEAGELSDEPIPPIQFDSADKSVMKMLSASLDAIPKYGSWQGWSSSTNFRFFLS